MPAVFEKLDIIGLVIAGILTIVAGILLSSRYIDFLTFILLIFIAMIIPIGRIVYPFIIKDILKIEEEKRKIKEDVFDIWKKVWERLKSERTLGTQDESAGDKPSLLPANQLVIQKFNIYVAEFDLSHWITTVKTGIKTLSSNVANRNYRAVIVFDLYSLKIIEENYGMDIKSWEDKFVERADRGYYSKTVGAPRIIIPEALLGMLPREMLAGGVETSEGKKK